MIYGCSFAFWQVSQWWPAGYFGQKNRARSFDRTFTKALLLFRRVFRLADGEPVVNDRFQKIEICGDQLFCIAFVQSNPENADE